MPSDRIEITYIETTGLAIAARCLFLGVVTADEVRDERLGQGPSPFCASKEPDSSKLDLAPSLHKKPARKLRAGFHRASSALVTPTGFKELNEIAHITNQSFHKRFPFLYYIALIINKI